MKINLKKLEDIEKVLPYDRFMDVYFSTLPEWELIVATLKEAKRMAENALDDDSQVFLGRFENE